MLNPIWDKPIVAEFFPAARMGRSQARKRHHSWGGDLMGKFEINGHTHIFNFASVFTENSLKILLDRIES